MERKMNLKKNADLNFHIPHAKATRQCDTSPPWNQWKQSLVSNLLSLYKLPVKPHYMSSEKRKYLFTEISISIFWLHSKYFSVLKFHNSLKNNAVNKNEMSMVSDQTINLSLSKHRE